MTVTDITSVLITGPTRGLGRSLVDELARRGTSALTLLGRPSDALQAVADQARRAGVPHVAVLPVDLADLRSVHAVGPALRAAVDAGHPPPDALVLNAGIRTSDRRQVSAQGHELTFAVNVLAQHLLLTVLLPQTAAGGQAVLLGSGTHWGGRHSMYLVPRPSWQDPLLLARGGSPDVPEERSAGARAYATSKLAVVHLAHVWQRRAQSGQRVNVYDPGLMPGTGLARDLRPHEQWVWRTLMPGLRVLPGVTSPDRSSRHLAGLVLGERHAALRGGYVELGRARRSSPASYDAAREDRLWEVCEELAAQAADAPQAGAPEVGRLP